MGYAFICRPKFPLRLACADRHESP